MLCRDAASVKERAFFRKAPKAANPYIRYLSSAQTVRFGESGVPARHTYTMAFSTMCLVIFCCCANVVVLELIMKRNSQSGNIVTFMQFIFIALEGFVVTMNFGSKRLSIPLRRSMALVMLSFAVNVSNNWALNFNISMPLHMIFKSGSLLANMMMNIIVLRRRYSLGKFVSVGLVTIGIIMCTMASAKEMSSHGNADFFQWLIGVGLLSFSLFASAYLGIMQERLYQQHPNTSKEMMFVAHSVPLPGFLFLSSDLSARFAEYNESPTSPFVPIPIMWSLLALNTLLQYTCLRSVYKLQTLCSSLTVTLVITLRKFVSLIFSIIYFENPFTVQHWIGAVLVFVGALMFAEVILIPGLSERKPAKKHVS